MADLSLEPYSAVQHWEIRQLEPAPERLLKEYLELLAQQCQAVENCVIGHIKALALFPDHSYLRVSVTAANLPATLDGAAPAGSTVLDVTLNLLVYGLPRTQAAAISQSAADLLMQKYPLKIETLPQPQKGAAHHPHFHG